MHPVTKMNQSKDISDRFQHYFESRYPGAQVMDFRFLTSGYESDVFTFINQPAKGDPKPLILRVFPGENVTTKQVQEVRGLHLLQQAGFPVAAVLGYETDPAILGQPFTIMEKLKGKAIWPLLYQFPQAQADILLDRFSTLLVRLHQLDWRPFTPQPDRYEANPNLLLDEDLADSRQWFQRFGIPGFTAVTDWLEAHKSEITMQRAVIHLDFHANNVFLCDDDRLAVIDWTQIGVGDYRVDLCWTLLIMGDYGQPHWKERILRIYCQEAAHPIEGLDYFMVIADTRNLASTIISSQTNLAALGLNPVKSGSLEQQVSSIRKMYWRIQQTTGVTIPEVEAVLRMS